MGSHLVTLRPLRDPFESAADYRSRLKGRLLHQALYFARTVEDFKRPQTLVKKAFYSLGEHMARWDIEDTFIRPLMALYEIDEVETFFPQVGVAEVYREREFLVPTSDQGFYILRPDRVVVYQDSAIVVEFKTEERGPTTYKKHERQVITYQNVVKKSFGLPVSSYLLYLQPPHVVRVSSE